eukprot:snap_masked-scaffold_54-processed-gene-1.54-mRNA-1 protein AED:0.24 eAED:0.26 QI:0/0/0/0.88/1/1/9/0/224
MNKFDVIKVIGEGAYGIVLKCINKKTGDFVALKKFKSDDEEAIVHKNIFREVRILRILRHQNIVHLIEGFKRKGQLYLVFELMDKNLLECLEANPKGFKAKLVKHYAYQLCAGIKYCHEKNVIHRDIKPENILVNKDHRLKLCDFGFAREIATAGEKDLTDYVATRWYRAPELLLQSTTYDFTAIGCIIAELMNGQPLFPGETELDQVEMIVNCLGSIPKGKIL